jgi:hypothetical protein
MSSKPGPALARDPVVVRLERAAVGASSPKNIRKKSENSPGSSLVRNS